MLHVPEQAFFKCLLTCLRLGHCQRLQSVCGWLLQFFGRCLSCSIKDLPTLLRATIEIKRKDMRFSIESLDVCHHILQSA